MKKLKKFTLGSSVVLSTTQMMGVLGGDTDPNVCHSKTTDETCSGSCYQYTGGKAGSCKWDYTTHSCGCQVTQ